MNGAANTSENEVLIDAMKGLMVPDIVTIADNEEVIVSDGRIPTWVSVPKGRELKNVTQDLHALAGKPRRVSRSTSVYDAASFVALVRRHRRPNTVVYATPLAVSDDASIVAVCDDDALDAPAWRDTVVHFAPQTSAEWDAWVKADGAWMKLPEFAEFLEERLLDVIPPSTESLSPQLQDLITTTGLRLAGAGGLNALAQNVRINSDVKVANAVTLATGEIQMQYVETHRDDEGAPIRIANAFLIGVPVFFNGPRYQVLVRLRYRLQGGGVVVWSVSLHDADRVEQVAFDDIVDLIREAEIGAVVLGGAPPAVEP